MPVICLLSLLCVFVFQSTSYAALPFEKQIAYRVALIEQWHNGELIDTGLSLKYFPGEIGSLKKIRITVYSNEIGSSELRAALWKEAVLVLVRGKGVKYVIGKSSSVNGGLIDNIQIKHQLDILSPPVKSDIFINKETRLAEGTFTVQFAEPQHRRHRIPVFSSIFENISGVFRAAPFSPY